MMKHSRKHLPFSVFVVLLAALLLLQPCLAATKDPVTASEPMVYVSDLANVLSDTVEASMTAQSAALDALTGAQLVVVTVDFLGGENIRDYSRALFNRLQIGDATKNNGLLLLLVTGEDNYYALQGKGLETALSDAMLEDLLQEYLEPDFTAGFYEAGAQKTYAALLNVFGNLYDLGDQGVLVAAAEAKEAQIKIERANRQKQGLLFAAGAVLLILLPAAMLAVATGNAGRRRRKRRKESVVRQRTDD